MAGRTPRRRGSLVKPNIQISQFVKSEVAFDTRRDQILYDRGKLSISMGISVRSYISRSTKRGYCLPEATADIFTLKPPSATQRADE